MRNKFNRLDSRHKLAILASLVAWSISIYYSYLGFATEATRAKFIGLALAGIVTVVELVFNSRTRQLSMTLIVVGVLCYLYGVWTNIVGFWDFQNPSVQFPWFHESAILSWFVGSILEILPEPLFMWGIGSELEGDLLGNLIGLWQGDLEYARPENQAQHPIGFHPNVIHQQPVSKKPKLTTKKSGLVSPIFNQRYTDRYKNRGS